MALIRRTLGCASRLAAVCLAVCFLFAALQDVEAHKKKSHKPSSSTAAPASAATAGPCPEVKPSCCLMSFFDKELDPDSFKDSDSCPLHCCGLPDSKDPKGRSLIPKGAEHKKRLVEYLKCVKKMIANLMKPDYRLPENCCSKFITFNQTKFCQEGPGPQTTPLPSPSPSPGQSTTVGPSGSPSQGPNQMTTVSPDPPSSGPTGNKTPTTSPNQVSPTATTLAPNQNNRTRSGSKRRHGTARPDDH